VDPVVAVALESLERVDHLPGPVRHLEADALVRSPHAAFYVANVEAHQVVANGGDGRLTMVKLG